MSIKSLFEDIADAIREKSGSSDTYTPAEMPSAIRSIPSGSSTASGVSYDNTSSGLTASNVQDAIDELSGDISTINSDLSELTMTIIPTTKVSDVYSVISGSIAMGFVPYVTFNTSSSDGPFLTASLTYLTGSDALFGTMTVGATSYLYGVNISSSGTKILQAAGAGAGTDITSVSYNITLHYHA